MDKGPPVGGSFRTSVRFGAKATGIPDYCTPGAFNPDGCLYWSPEQIVYPFSGELNTIFITTRVSIYQSQPNLTCNYIIPSTPSCAAPTIATLKSTKKTYYPAYVETLTLMFDHKYIQINIVYEHNRRILLEHRSLKPVPVKKW